MNADLSVAPEIAQLAAPLPPPFPQPRAAAAPRTAGRAAAELSRLAAAPQQWWDLVRFDPDGPVKVPVPGASGAWLLILPPGASACCDCGYATLLAGEAAESPAPPSAPRTPAAASAAAPGTAAPASAAPAAPAALARPLRAGRVRVNGRPAPHQVRGAGHGYAVSLHWAATTSRSGK